MDDLANGRLDRIIVTKRGRPLAVVSPVSGQVARFEDVHGAMKGTTWIEPGFDVTAPILEPGWENEMLKS